MRTRRKRALSLMLAVVFAAALVPATALAAPNSGGGEIVPPVESGSAGEQSAEPSGEFTAEPTVEPTTEPTVEPTTEPTAEPTTEPTAEPTTEPTAVPTTEPTAEPTTEPMAEPTAVPTAEPTAEPTTEPTAEPTAVPTAEPTAEPSPEPTAAQAVQALIDALPEPEEITEEDRADVEAQLAAIDEAKLALTDQERESLDVTRYEAVVAALLALDEPMAIAVESATYYDPTENTTKTAENATVIDSDNTSTTWSENWYVVEGDVTIASRVTVSGSVNLILADGCSLTASQGITVENSNSLTIWGQSSDWTGNGRLTATGGPNDWWNTGIGSNGQDKQGGTITINGGHVTAKGTAGSPGIGGNERGATVAIHGGYVESTGGGQNSSGIGGGSGDSVGCDVTITGGIIVASAGGGSGSGIGGGGSSKAGKVTITGGDIKATGGDTGSGIGGENNTVTITGGTVTATAGRNSTGIGGSGGDITITGGTVTATGNGTGAGIGGKSFSAAGGHATIHASSIPDKSGIDEWGGVIFDGDDGYVCGDQTLTGDLVIGPGQSLTVREGASLTVAEGATLTNNGTIHNSGTIEVEGTLDNEGDLVNMGGLGVITGTVTGNAPETDPGTPYVDRDPATGAPNPSYCADPLVVEEGTTRLGSGWYVVNSSITIAERITVSGDVHLILADGCGLTAQKGISVGAGSSLTIYCQEEGTGYLDATNPRNTQGNPFLPSTGGGAAIGGDKEQPAGNITINGGYISATVVSDGGACIGSGGFGGAGGTVTINGGYVTLKCNAGDEGAFGTSTGKINGGVVEYTGSATESLENATKNRGIVFNGDDGTVYGDFVLEEDMTFDKGKLTIPEGSSLTVQNGRVLTITEEGSLDAQGDITVGSGGSLFVDFGGSMTTSGDITVQDGGELDVTEGSLTASGDITVKDNGRMSVEYDGPLDAQGDITVRNGGELSVDDGTLNAQGNVTVGPDGNLTVDFYGSMTASGDITVQDGGSIVVEEYGALDAKGTVTVGPDGSLTVSDYGSMTASGDVTVQENGSLTVEENGSLTVQDGGSLTTAGDVTVGTLAELTVDHGTLTVEDKGSLTVEKNGSLTVQNEGEMTVREGGKLTVEENGSLTVEDNGNLTVLGEVVADDATVQTGGTIEKRPAPTAPAVVSGLGTDSAAMESAEDWQLGVQYGYAPLGGTPEQAVWQDTPDFSGLSPATGYTFYVHYLGNTFYEEKYVSGGDYYTMPNAPALGTGYTVDYRAETVTAAVGCEISMDGVTWVTGPVAVVPGATIYVRVAAVDGGAPVSETVTNGLSTRLAAPNISGVDETEQGRQDGSITGVDPGMEYQLSGDDHWTDCGDTLTGLAPGTYLVRYKATDTAFCSEPVEVTIGVGAPPVEPTAAPTATPTTAPTATPAATAAGETAPDTGDEAAPLLWALILCLSGGALAAVLIRRGKNG